MPGPRLCPLELGGEREQRLLAAGAATSCTAPGMPGPGTGTDAAGKPARFHTPVNWGDISDVATLRGQDRPP